MGIENAKDGKIATLTLANPAAITAATRSPSPAAGVPARAQARARELFLDEAHVHGCAETAFVALKEAFGLPDAADSAAAMALNGGVAWSGSTCGAVTGAALALGQLAASRIPDHAAAKRAARERTGELLDALEAAFGATTCLELTGLDLRTEEGHRAFLEGGAWRDGCMRQLELVVGLAAARGLESAPAGPGDATGQAPDEVDPPRT